MDTVHFYGKQEISFHSILKFVIPACLTSLFNTFYTITDGIFVSACVGTDALAAINTVYPVVNILTGIALIFATGGSAIAAFYIGAGENKQASQAFSVSVVLSVLAGGIFSVLVLFWMPFVLWLLGATPVIENDCGIYLIIWLAGTPVVIAKELFTYFIRADGSPVYSFFTAFSGGVTNIILDYVLIVRLRMGIWGAGLATVLGLVMSCLIGICYFVKYKKVLYFTTHNLRLSQGWRCFMNGTSEFIDQMSVAVTTIAFNWMAWSFAGEDGIAAVSIIMYLQFVIIGIYFGYAMGISPLSGYSFGNGKVEICQKLEMYSRRFYTIAPGLLYGLTFISAPSGVSFFAAKGSVVYHLAVYGMRVYGLGFLCSGFNIYTAIRLTAYGRGQFAGIITFMRSFLLLLPALLLLPEVWGITGIWLSVPVAEILTFLISVYITMIFRVSRLCRSDSGMSGKLQICNKNI